MFVGACHVLGNRYDCVRRDTPWRVPCNGAAITMQRPIVYGPAGEAGYAIVCGHAMACPYK